MNTQDRSSAEPAMRNDDIPINTRTAWRPWLEPIGRFLVLAQLALVLQPVSALAQQPVSALAQQQSVVTQAPAAPIQPGVQDMAAAQELVAQLRMPYGADKAGKNQQLRGLLSTIMASAEATKREFAAARAQLQRDGVPSEILSRHDEAVLQFERRVSQFGQIASTADDQQRVNQLDQFFKKYPASKRHGAADTGKLPWGSPKAAPRMPAETRTAWFQKLYGDQKVQVAQAAGASTIGGIQFTVPPDPTQAPTDADLAGTIDAQLTAGIRSKAQELGYNPVRIHSWVQDNVHWLPTWGSMQGAEGTLNTLRGNAFDIASLTVALLRASGIPARYQFGTIDVPVVQAMNWIGGVQKPEAALALMYQGGIAARALSSGGRIVAIRMEHVWVNAYVNWTPSRGARQGGAVMNPPMVAAHGQPQHPHPNAKLNGWVPLDPSFKQYSFTQGMGLKTAVPVDANAFIAAAQKDAELSANAVQMLNQPALQSQLTMYQQQLKDYVDAQKPNASVEDIYGSKVIQPASGMLLAGTVPNTVNTLGLERTELPDSLRWAITFKLHASEYDKLSDTALLRKRFVLPELGGKRVSVSSAPATQADKDLVDRYVATNAASLPLYLIKQKVRLGLDEEIVAETGAQGMGSDQWWSYVLESPSAGAVEEDFKLVAAVGDAIVFGIDAYGVSFAEVARRAQHVNPDSSFENLNHFAIGYWARAHESDQLLARQYDVVAYRLPSVGAFASPLSITYSWGIPRFGTYSGYAVDVRRLAISAQGKSDPGATVPYLKNSGAKNSFLEGRIFEEVLDLAPGGGVSAVRVIASANELGVPLWNVQSGNLAEYLAASTLSGELKSGILSAVTNGWDVLAPQAPVDVGRWVGGAYVAVDPATGSGAYIIGGNANGGGFEACEFKVQPLAEAIAQRLLTQVAIRIALFLAAEAGLAAASVLAPPAAPALAQAMVMVGITFLTFSAEAADGSKCGSRSKDCHRGRFQAQGLDIYRNSGRQTDTRSRAWALPVPPTLSEGLAFLNELKGKLLPSEMVRRTLYFAQMEAYVQAAGAAGGICAPFPGKSFQSQDDSSADAKDRIRVDLEVNAGAAFGK